MSERAPRAPMSVSGEVLALQHTAGNAAVAALVSRSPTLARCGCGTTGTGGCGCRTGAGGHEEPAIEDPRFAAMRSALASAVVSRRASRQASLHA
jgi:hypothetical protein